MSMTIKEAAKKADIPPSRIQRAIQKGWLKTILDKGKHKFAEKDFDAIVGSHIIAERIGQTFHVIVTKRLRVRSKVVKMFNTKAAADEFETMIKKQ